MKLTKQIPFQWKIQSVTKDGKASCVAYIDARDVMKLLDEEVGIGKWQDKFDTTSKYLICSIGIKIDNEWIWKSDTGADMLSEKVDESIHDKGLFSDAFKRAAVKWGVGRFLYDLDIQWIKVNAYKKPLDDEGRQVYDLTKYLNDRLMKKDGANLPPKSTNIANEAKKIKIKNLVDKIDKPKTADEYVDKILALTELDPTDYKNSDEIIARLSIILTQKNGG